MPERATAGEQLERILYVLPRAARDGGAPLDELAAALGVGPADVLKDLHEVMAREFYHPAGAGDDIQVRIGPDCVTVWTTGEFRWPVRLSPGEALALGLGLRVLAAEAGRDRRAELLALAARLEGALTTAPPPDAERFRAVLAADDEDVLSALVDAARERRVCRIGYLKSGAAGPDEHRVHPYTLAFAEGAWYVLGFAETRDAMRVFRLDRILAAELEDASFEVPASFDPARFIAEGGKLFRADGDEEVAVRYSPRIARWLAERLECETWEDGSVVVRHRVADPGWLVRHVLQYGGEAVVLEHAELRARIGGIAERLAG